MAANAAKKSAAASRKGTWEGGGRGSSRAPPSPCVAQARTRTRDGPCRDTHARGVVGGGTAGGSHPHARQSLCHTHAPLHSRRRRGRAGSHCARRCKPALAAVRTAARWAERGGWSGALPGEAPIIRVGRAGRRCLCVRYIHASTSGTESPCGWRDPARPRPAPDHDQHSSPATIHMDPRAHTSPAKIGP